METIAINQHIPLAKEGLMVTVIQNRDGKFSALNIKMGADNKNPYTKADFEKLKKCLPDDVFQEYNYIELLRFLDDAQTPLNNGIACKSAHTRFIRMLSKFNTIQFPLSMEVLSFLCLRMKSITFTFPATLLGPIIALGKNHSKKDAMETDEKTSDIVGLLIDKLQDDVETVILIPTVTVMAIIKFQNNSKKWDSCACKLMMANAQKHLTEFIKVQNDISHMYSKKKTIQRTKIAEALETWIIYKCYAHVLDVAYSTDIFLAEELNKKSEGVAFAKHIISNLDITTKTSPKIQLSHSDFDLIADACAEVLRKRHWNIQGKIN